MIVFRGLAKSRTTWFHVCTLGTAAYISLNFDECETCGITQAQAAKRYPKKNKHLKEKKYLVRKNRQKVETHLVQKK